MEESNIQPINENSRENNICKFAVQTQADDNLFAFQFVFETMPQNLPDDRMITGFTCNIVTDGEAILYTKYGEFRLSKGDLFFIFPAEKFSIKNCCGLKYMYISFAGSRPSALLKSRGITREMPVRHGFSDIESVWFQGITKCTSKNLFCIAKGVLYYTLALVADNESENDIHSCSNNDENVFLQIKQHIECCYADPELSLNNICTVYRYNNKYISHRFKEVTGVGFQDYLEGCRIRHAAVLLSETTFTIREIATSVGYKDPLYFSKVFKKIMFVSPSEYKETQRNTENHGKDKNNK